jgi:DNA-binding LytR/AlgR family response regulator
MKIKINQNETIEQTDIILLRADINYTTLILADKKITSSRTLKIVSQWLNSELFVKINRGVVVNKNFIKTFNNDKLNAYITLSNNETFTISRKRFDEVCLALNVI